MAWLNGKRALVTGGSRGIGAAIARRLAREGADVAITYERSAGQAGAIVAEIETLGRRALAIAADSADAAVVEAAIDRTASELGGLDILVNNAGIFQASPFEALTLAEIDRMIAVNLRAPIVAAQAAIPHMGEGGRIISIGSNLAERVPEAGITLYALSKAALIGFTKGLARDLGPRGISVNVIHPGSTSTDMNPADGPHAEAQLRRMAIQRYGDPNDIAGLIAWLASDEGRSVTGAGFTIDGGANA